MARLLAQNVHEASPDEMVPRLCRLTTQLLPVDGASISLMAKGEGRQTLCSTDAMAAQLSDAHYSLGSGPGLYAFEIGAPVFVPDLDGADGQRWPVFAMRARELGAAAVYCFPLAVGAIAVGTMDLHRANPGSLDDPEVAIALLLADAATLGVMRLYSGKRDPEYLQGKDGASWLAGTADYDEVHQATGMVMVQCGVGAEEALLRLRARAFADGKSLGEFARDVVARRVRLDEHE